MVSQFVEMLIGDHIGHGFARYSVTKDWSLPHFEKMYLTVVGALKLGYMIKVN